MSAQEPNVPYTGTTGERLKAFALNDETRDRLALLASKYWEITAYAVLGLFAAILRFYDLGSRAMHHDESLHGFFSYGFTQALRDVFTFNIPSDHGYEHVPFMHGPFQFIGNGFVMFIFGDGEYQARMLAATMGTAMVIMPFFFRAAPGPHRRHSRGDVPLLFADDPLLQPLHARGHLHGVLDAGHRHLHVALPGDAGEQVPLPDDRLHGRSPSDEGDDVLDCARVPGVPGLHAGDAHREGNPREIKRHVECAVRVS